MHVMPIMKYNPSITPGNGSAWNVMDGIGYFFRPGEFPEFSISKCLDLSHMPSEYWAKSAVTCIPVGHFSLHKGFRALHCMDE